MKYAVLETNQMQVNPISVESVCDREQGLLQVDYQKSSLKEWNLSEELKVEIIFCKTDFSIEFLGRKLLI